MNESNGLVFAEGDAVQQALADVIVEGVMARGAVAFSGAWGPISSLAVRASVASAIVMVEFPESGLSEASPRASGGLHTKVFGSARRLRPAFGAVAEEKSTKSIDKMF